jgi:hypothetical protein
MDSLLFVLQGSGLMSAVGFCCKEEREGGGKVSAETQGPEEERLVKITLGFCTPQLETLCAVLSGKGSH